MTSAMRIDARGRRSAARRVPCRGDAPCWGDAALDRHRDVAAVTREPVAEQLSRLVRALQGTNAHHRSAEATAGGHVLRSYHDRGRTHEHRLAQVLRQSDLAVVRILARRR